MIKYAVSHKGEIIPLKWTNAEGFDYYEDSRNYDHPDWYDLYIDSDEHGVVPESSYTWLRYYNDIHEASVASVAILWFRDFLKDRIFND